MKTHDNLGANIILQNNKPVDDFLGLSSAEMHNLISNTFSDKSIVRILDNIDDKTLDHIPLFRI